MKNQTSFDYQIRTTWLSITKMYNEMAAEYDSTMTFGFTLLSIDPKNGTPSTHLGPKMGIEPTSLTRTLKTLEEKKLIYKSPNPTDKRSVFIKLTEKGLEMRNVSKQIVLSFYEQIEQQIPKEKLDIFNEVLDTIYHISNNHKIIQKYEESTY